MSGNNYEYEYPEERVSIIGQFRVPQDGTDIKIASYDQTPSAGVTTLATITVKPGYYCVIGDVDFYSGTASGGTMTMSYTDPISSTAVSRTIALAAAGFTELAHDFKDHPFAAVYNPSSATANLSITFKTNAAGSTKYVMNAAYVLRPPNL